jgi:hypothetical protein
MSDKQGQGCGKEGWGPDRLVGTISTGKGYRKVEYQINTSGNFLALLIKLS